MTSQRTLASTHRAYTREKPDAENAFISEKLMTNGDIEDELDDFELDGTIIS